MINQEAFNNVIAQYKPLLAERLTAESEGYKWKAVKTFQDNWDENAADFAAMLKKSLTDAGNLLTSYNYYAQLMIVEYAEKHSSEVRMMFTELFDESKDFVERIRKFMEKSEELKNNPLEHTYQNEHTVFTYLCFRYPEKYYIYKIGVIIEAFRRFGSDYEFFNGPKKQEKKDGNIRNFMAFYREINDLVLQDKELCDAFRAEIEKHEQYYQDPGFCMLAQDIAYFVHQLCEKEQKMQKAEDSDWQFSKYDPGISKEKWLELWNNPNVFNDVAKNIILCIHKHDNQATCKELAESFGNVYGYYNAGAVKLAERVQAVTNCQKPAGDKLWPILFIGKDAAKEQSGDFIWKLRDELAEAVEETVENTPDEEIEKLMSVAKDEQQTDSQAVSYWWLNACPEIWRFSNVKVNQEVSYTLFTKSGTKRRIAGNFIAAKPGDKFIGYETTPVKKRWHWE